MNVSELKTENARLVKCCAESYRKVAKAFDALLEEAHDQNHRGLLPMDEELDCDDDAMLIWGVAVREATKNIHDVDYFVKQLDRNKDGYKGNDLPASVFCGQLIACMLALAPIARFGGEIKNLVDSNVPTWMIATRIKWHATSLADYLDASATAFEA